MATVSPPKPRLPGCKNAKKSLFGCENGHISSFLSSASPLKNCADGFLAHLVKQPINNETADHVAICVSVCISHFVIFSDYNRIMCPR